MPPITVSDAIQCPAGELFAYATDPSRSGTNCCDWSWDKKV
jgi:hypothetical protein